MTTADHAAAPPRSAAEGSAGVENHEFGDGGYWSPPRWCSPGALVLCVLGLAVATYLTYEHYTASKTLTCPVGGGAINCLKVTTSVYSKIHGVPVADLGLIFFAIMIVLQLPGAWRSQSRAVRLARLGWALVGVGTAIWLIYAELFKIDAICLWCTSVHILSLAIFAVTAVGTASGTAGPALD